MLRTRKKKRLITMVKRSKQSFNYQFNDKTPTVTNTVLYNIHVLSYLLQIRVRPLQALN